MNMTNRHLTWYQQQHVPGWAQGLQQQNRVTIDEIVNLNAYSSLPDMAQRAVEMQKMYLSASHAVALLKLVRKNYQWAPVNRYVNEDVKQNLWTYMSEYTQQDERRWYYKRWAKKLLWRRMGVKNERGLQKVLNAAWGEQNI